MQYPGAACERSPRSAVSVTDSCCQGSRELNSISSWCECSFWPPALIYWLRWSSWKQVEWPPPSTAPTFLLWEKPGSDIILAVPERLLPLDGSEGEWPLRELEPVLVERMLSWFVTSRFCFLLVPSRFALTSQYNWMKKEKIVPIFQSFLYILLHVPTQISTKNIKIHYSGNP